MLIFGLHLRNEWTNGHPKSLPPSVAALFVQGPEERSPAADGPWPNWPRLVSWIPSMTISHHLPVSPIDIQSQTWREVNNAGEGPGRPQLVKTSEFTPFDLPSEWGVNIKWYQVSTWSYMIHGSDWARCLFMLKWISHDITQCEISQTCPVQPRCWRNRWQQTSSRNWTKQINYVQK